MKHRNSLISGLVLTGLALSPGIAAAIEDLAGLDVTMEVLDEEAEFSELATELRRPDDGGLAMEYFESDDQELAHAEDDARGEPGYDFDAEIDERDEFEDDEISAKDELRYEDDFEDLDGEDVDEEADFDEVDDRQGD